MLGLMATLSELLVTCVGTNGYLRVWTNGYLCELLVTCLGAAGYFVETTGYLCGNRWSLQSHESGVSLSE